MSNEQYLYMQEMLKSSPTKLGLVSNSTWIKDPKRLLFSLSRYKFVSKLLHGRTNVLEIGCGDGWNAKLVNCSVKSLTLTDLDPVFVNNALQNSSEWLSHPVCLVHDFLKSPLLNGYDAAYCLDVLEHIDPAQEGKFIRNIYESCVEHSVVIFGMPSLESQSYIAIDRRDPGHINCKSLYDLVATLNHYFPVVLPFSMNDEVLHTGHAPMSNYIFGVCIK